MAISWIQPSFAGGEIGPSLYGRIDMAKYQVALRKCDNFIVRQYGGVENRPGTRFVGVAKYPNRKCRLIPFQFSTVQTYALEFGYSRQNRHFAPFAYRRHIMGWLGRIR